MSKTLDRRVTDLERRPGTLGPCACRLRIAVVYDDMPREDGDGDVSPASSSPTVASPLCPHGRPWQGGDVEYSNDIAG